MALKKTIKYEIDEYPNGEKINEDGEFVFNLFTSNFCEDDFSNAIIEIASLWESVPDLDIPLTINVRLKEVIETMIEMYSIDNEIDEEDLPVFQALRKDCAWMISQIDALKVKSKKET